MCVVNGCFLLLNGVLGHVQARFFEGHAVQKRPGARVGEGVLEFKTDVLELINLRGAL